MSNLLLEEKKDKLSIKGYSTSIEMGKAAADFVSRHLQSAIAKKGSANLILATGASQFSFLDAFKSTTSFDWSKVTVFHLDEYVGIQSSHPASFRRYLRERILDEVHPHKIYFLDGDATNIGNVIEKYEQQLKSHPIDVACIGIGENGHIAFNDPAVADFNDPKMVKIVDLDEKSRRQQVNEGWFETLEEVPKQALSLTIPAIMRSETISCVVPDQRKAEAVSHAISGPVSTQCPASILRTHPDTVLFLDQYSASGIIHGHL
ncbi:MAG TPA: glucosamine-6-phosphate deaminase [Balneolales bacterium]|nr:glucosamine-6-phosphate deaminase [Balneolales bacterium]